MHNGVKVALSEKYPPKAGPAKIHFSGNGAFHSTLSFTHLATTLVMTVSGGRLIGRPINVKLKYVLPVGQMGLAASLALSSYLWQTRWPTRCDAYGADPAFYLAESINFPTAALRGLWFGLYYQAEVPATTRYLLEISTLVALSGLLWYGVALTFASLWSRGTVGTFRLLALRVGVDMVLLLAGIYLGFCSVGESHQLGIALRGYSCWRPMLLSQCLSILSCVFQFGWSIALIVFSGCDLLYSALQRNATEAVASGR